ncbi:MAG: type I DNA topoisomerase [Synergistetes bacterium]|nr:MAG: DNA topoisomerase 1 [bacterium 42_11]MBC7330877.1 type I DNA topoisomerase [Synergistota bacterium]
MQDQLFLILVESPTKAKTIKRFLGKGYSIKATRGHVRDLPSEELGVDLNTFSPKWVFLKGKKKLLEKIASHRAIFLIATDPDREGERIAFDIWNFLKGKGISAKRIEFHEITPEAVREALANPRDIDVPKVNSAVARRVLDRLYGYLVSPVLWKSLKRKSLSAGRVQSCALKMIIDREREREKFVPQEWYELKVKLEAGENLLEAKLWDVKEDIPLKLSKKEAFKLRESLKGEFLRLLSLEDQEVLLPPLPPLKTATMIQKASSLLGLSSSATMREAQKLFELGYITYHRTDSLFISNKALKMAASFICGAFGKAYVKLRSFDKEGAHEAIRPTDLNLMGISPLYDLIWRHFVASQMADAKILKRRAIFSWENKLFVSFGEKVLFDGWTKVLKRKEKESIPELQGREFKVLDVSVARRKTSPPPRYTESTLVRELEKKGVGRPSTYATIISTLVKRGYVEKRKKFLIPTELGIRICSFLEELLGEELLSPSFTASMEEVLDRIEANIVEPDILVKEFYEALSSKLGGL